MKSRKEYLLRMAREKLAEAKNLLGGKCVKCGSTEDLEFDHINREDKSFTITSGWTSKDFWDEVVKCQLLCWECHNQKSIAELGKKIARGTHGTVSSYKYCRCEPCRHANIEYQKEYRKRKKNEGPRL